MRWNYGSRNQNWTSSERSDARALLHTRAHSTWSAMWRTLVLVVVVWCLHISSGLIIRNFKVSNDNRDQIFLESFGYRAGGVMKLNISDYKTKPESDSVNSANAFFVLKVTEIDIAEFEDKEIWSFFCKIDGRDNFDYGAKIDWDTLKSADGYTLKISDTAKPNTEGAEGVYNLFFINCDNSKYQVSFKMHLEQYNIDSYKQKDYLPAGLSPLPTVYFIFSGVYFILFFIWVFGYMRSQGAVLNKVHYLMTILMVLKFLSLLFYAVDQHTLKKNGVPDGWAVAYYVFAVLKTAFFFVIVTLIGTGWTFFKPFLSDKDKKIILVVIPLQILDNIAMVIVGSEAPGYFGWIAWKDIFRLVDIICCGAILIPIIWSIKHLREASQSDGKAARNLQKLRLFRQFYLIVVSYIYFTRIIIYLLDAALPYKLLFLGDVFTEGATLCFFVVVGYKFRPVSANPYFNVEEEDAVRLEEMRAAEED